MFTRPGHTIREYIEGKRVNHFSPLLLLIVAGGACSLFYEKANLHALFSPIKIHDIALKSSMLAHKYFALTMLIACILFSFGDYIIQGKRKYTIPEYFLGNAFICGQVLLIQLVMIPILMAGRSYGINEYLRAIFIGIILVYLFITKIQFFQAAGNLRLEAKILAVVSLLVYIGGSISKYILYPLLTG